MRNILIRHSTKGVITGRRDGISRNNVELRGRLLLADNCLLNNGVCTNLKGFNDFNKHLSGVVSDCL